MGCRFASCVSVKVLISSAWFPSCALPVSLFRCASGVRLTGVGPYQYPAEDANASYPVVACAVASWPRPSGLMRPQAMHFRKGPNLSSQSRRSPPQWTQAAGQKTRWSCPWSTGFGICRSIMSFTSFCARGPGVCVPAVPLPAGSAVPPAAPVLPLGPLLFISFFLGVLRGRVFSGGVLVLEGGADLRGAGGRPVLGGRLTSRSRGAPRTRRVGSGICLYAPASWLGHGFSRGYSGLGAVLRGPGPEVDTSRRVKGGNGAVGCCDAARGFVCGVRCGVGLPALAFRRRGRYRSGWPSTRPGDGSWGGTPSTSTRWTRTMGITWDTPGTWEPS